MSGMGGGGADEPRLGLRQGSRGLAGVVRESAAAWRQGGRPERAGLGVAGFLGAALLGAFGFGLVHVVGGAFHDNPRAVGFGVGLSALTGLLLAVLAWLTGRLVRRGSWA